MLSLLHLQGVIIYKVTEDEEKFNIKIGQPKALAKCIYCKSSKFIKNGKGRTRKLRHGIVISGKAIHSLWSSKCFRCKEYGKSWTTSPPKYLVEGRKRHIT